MSKHKASSIAIGLLFVAVLFLGTIILVTARTQNMGEFLASNIGSNNDAATTNLLRGIVGSTASSFALGNTEGYNQGGFYANGRIWTWYVRGTGDEGGGNGEEVLSSSADGGVHWGPSFVIRTSGGGSQFEGYFDGRYFHYLSTAPGALIVYRRGIPNGDGSISWSVPEQGAQLCGSDLHGCDQGAIAVDSNAHPWIGYATPLSDVPHGLPTNPYLSRDAKIDGSWETKWDYPIQLSLNATGPYCDWGVIIVPLTDGKVYVIYSHCGQVALGRLWDGLRFGPEEHVTQSVPVGNTRYVSAVSYGDDVYVVFADVNGGFKFVSRVYAIGKWNNEVFVEPETPTHWPFYVPALSIDNVGNLYLFWIGRTPDLSGDALYYRKYSANAKAWSGRVELASEPAFRDHKDRRDFRNIFVFRKQQGPYIGVTYEAGSAPPYEIKFVSLSTRNDLAIAPTFTYLAATAPSQSLYYPYLPFW